MKKILPLIFVITMLFAGGIFSSCKKHINGPPDDTSHKCDTCCDTCKKDTSHHPPCDTCNLNKDSLAHAFVWTEYINKIPGETNLTGVWVFGPNDIMICANSLYHFDGSNFTLIHCIRNGTNPVSMDGALNGNTIFAFSKTDFWLVHGSVAYHTIDGQHFDDFRPGTTNACWGSSPNDVYIVGNGGQIHHFDGTSFTQMTSNTTKDLHSVWGTSNSNIWAAGFNSQTAESVLLHFDGNNWANQDLSQLGGKIGVGGDGVGSVWTFDSSFHKKVFVGGGYLYRETDNNPWMRDSAITGNSLNDGSFIAINFIRGNSVPDYMVAGDWGFVSHWNGKTWKRYDALLNSGDPNYATQAFHYTGNTACIVGFRDGQSWMAVGTRKQ